MMISDHADPLAGFGEGGRGGQHVYVLQMATGLARQGATVDVYTRWDSPTKQEVVHLAPNLRVIRVAAGPRAPVARDEFIGFVSDFGAGVASRIDRESLRYDVVFAHYWYSGIVALELCRTHGLPMSFVYHSIGAVRRAALTLDEPSAVDEDLFATRDRWEKRIARESAALIANSPGERDDIVGLLGAAPDRISVIPVGVDVDLFAPADRTTVRAELGIAGDARAVVYAGRLERRKGVSTLIEALHILNEGPLPAELYILGNGGTPSSTASDDEIGQLRRQVAQLGLDDRVHFLGARPQPEVARWFAAADVCAVPSFYEPYGLVPVEAMACGTPVVASGTGGIRFTVADGVTGHLVTPRSAVELAAGLRTALAHGRAFYEAATRDRAVSRFSWPATVRQTMRHLTGLAGTAPSGARADASHPPCGPVRRSPEAVPTGATADHNRSGEPPSRACGAGGAPGPSPLTATHGPADDVGGRR